MEAQRFCPRPMQNRWPQLTDRGEPVSSRYVMRGTAQIYNACGQMSVLEAWAATAILSLAVALATLLWKPGEVKNPEQKPTIESAQHSKSLDVTVLGDSKTEKGVKNGLQKTQDK